MIHLDNWFFYDETKVRRKDPVFLEIGVFTVEKAVAFCERYPAAKVHLVEPDPVNWKTLTTRAAPYPDFRLHKVALSDHDGRIDLYRFDHEQQHSTFPRHTTCGLKLRDTANVLGVTLDTMIEGIGLEYVDLLLINCEGAEIYALRDLVKCGRLRDRIGQVCTSFHCDHTTIYPVSVRESLIADLSPFYRVAVGTAPIPYYLLTPKG